MPTRPRSHQIEDISIREFRAVLPAPWFCREKDRDYGVDLEVEVFDQTGLATGITLNAQLKATDDLSKERQVSILTDRLYYLASLDAPSIIVRYCAPTNSIFWMWNIDALKLIAPGAQSVTLHFGDANQWHQGTPERLAAALLVLRQLKTPSRSTCFPLLPKHESSARDALVCEQALSEVSLVLPFTAKTAKRPSSIPLQVTFKNDSITIGLDPIGTTQFEISSGDKEEIVDCLLYGLILLFHQYEYVDQSIATARYCLARGRPSRFKPLGIAAAAALVADPKAAVELAFINGIHMSQDFEYSMFIVALLGSDAPKDAKSAAVQSFYRQAISMQEKEGVSCGAIHYSLANSLAGTANYRESIRSFNAARKADSEYMGRSYFLREIGGVLFRQGRYRCSAAAYKGSVELEADPKTTLCLGDALMFAGNYVEAEHVFGQLKDGNEATISKEARLKQTLSGWLVRTGIVADVDTWASYARSANSEGRGLDAWAACLAIAFMVETDFQVWADTILITATHCNRDVLSDVLMCASMRCGMDAYLRFKEKIAAVGVDDALMENVDALNLEMYELRHSAYPATLTARVL